MQVLEVFNLLLLRRIVHRLWFNFILGSNFIFHCYLHIIMYYHTKCYGKLKLKTKDKVEAQHIWYVLLASNILSGGDDASREL